MSPPDRSEDGGPGTIDWATALFCATWAGLALIAWQGGGLGPGLAMLFGPLPAVAAAAWWFLIRQGDAGATRAAWWAILVVATLILMIWLAG